MRVLQSLRTLLPLVGVIIIGTVGYTVIEGWRPFDALYMTVISLTTVGYGETHPLTDGGKVFTIVLILLGIGNVAFVVSKFSMGFFQPFLEEIVKGKKMEQRLRQLKGHYIICGFGRIGRDVSESLVAAGVPVVIIDKSPPHKEGEPESTIPYIVGDASQDDVLERAGIMRARGLVASVKSEAENVFITLSAREFNADLFIISRFEEEKTQAKLLRAGANRVINPYQIGSQKISQIILKPTINKILDKVSKAGEWNLSFEELDLRPGNPLIGKTLRSCRIRDEHNIIIIAIEKADRTIITNPGPNYEFCVNDRIVMIANEKELINVFKKYGRQ